MSDERKKFLQGMVTDHNNLGLHSENDAGLW